MRWPRWWLALLLCLVAVPGGARTLEGRIERIDTAAATLQGVRVELEWPEDAAAGRLRVRAERLEAGVGGYRLRDLDWACPLRRAGGGWSCDGPVAIDGTPGALSVALGGGDLHAAFASNAVRAAVSGDAGVPDVWNIDLAGIPLAWLQRLLEQAWPEGRITGGRGDAQLRLGTAPDAPTTLAGTLRLDDAGFDSVDGRLAGEALDATFGLEASFGELPRFSVDGRLAGGGLLVGPAYIEPGPAGVELALRAQSRPDGWALPVLRWNDPGVLALEGAVVLAGGAGTGSVQLRFDAPDLAPAGERYLRGLLGVAGLGELALDGAARGHLQLRDGVLEQAELALAAVDVEDGAGRFGFRNLDGVLRFSGSGEAVRGGLGWSGGHLHTVALGAAQLPLHSAGGTLRLEQDVAVPVLGGAATLSGLQVRAPAPGVPFKLEFGLALEALDVATLAAALEWPDFGGYLSGNIPRARYTANRLELDGGLEMELFGGRVTASGLAMERPFGVAPTLTADVRIDDLDLAALTGAFEIGGITGRLDGRVDGLRLLDWRPVAFDAWLATDPRHRVRRRISQRAVQDISSVGDASLVGTVQGRLIGLFDDFGYSRIGIGCVLRDEVCRMRGLRPAPGEGFVIVAGSGLPHLSVVGYNQRVDWPTLVERLAGLAGGDVKPVVE